MITRSMVRHITKSLNYTSMGILMASSMALISTNSIKMNTIKALSYEKTVSLDSVVYKSGAVLEIESTSKSISSFEEELNDIINMELTEQMVEDTEIKTQEKLENLREYEEMALIQKEEMKEQQKLIEKQQKELERIAQEQERLEREKTDTQYYMDNMATEHKAKVDDSYISEKISITGQNRDLLERLVMGEAGNQSVFGAALVAQCLRDTMVLTGETDLIKIRKALGYVATFENEPNEDVKKAVSFIFDMGGYAVKHRIIYFYNPNRSYSSFHESQTFVIHFKGHKVFDQVRK